MRTRLEILKNGEWVELVLGEEKIKYNIISNKIGDFDQRRISHSNTFSLPYVSENIIALDINPFSPILMAEALNKKFPSRYFVKDKLIQRGFLVINNTVRGDINVNFIDESLTVTDEWGKLTFRQLLQLLVQDPSKFPKHTLSSSFLDNLTQLSNYNLHKNSIVENTTFFSCIGDDPSIENKDIYVARFPNCLNNIGDAFQIDKYKNRRTDRFNPFQSRPIFSVFSLIYAACQSFGYNLRLDPGVDFLALRDSYLTDKGVSEGTPEKDKLVWSTTPEFPQGEAQYWGRDKHGIGSGDNEGWFNFVLQYPNTTVTVDNYGKKVGIESLTPFEVGGGYYPTTLQGRTRQYMGSQKVIAKIETDNLVGEVVWTGEVTPRVPADRFQFSRYKVVSVWRTIVGTVFEAHFEAEWTTTETPLRTFEIRGEKSQLNNIPVGGHEFIGLVCQIEVKHDDEYYDDAPSSLNHHLVESILPKGTTNFDKYGQFLNDSANLLDLAPNTSIKELLANVLQQQGLLLIFERDSSGIQNVVKLFTYGAYRDRVREARQGIGDTYYDWSQYHQKYVPPLFNTDYGNKYGEMNEISLDEPFSGNISRVQISTNITQKGFQSKLIPLAQNKTKALKDVSAVNYIGDTVPYFQYTNTEQGLIYCSFDEYLGGVRYQYNAELDSDTGVCNPLAKVGNIIYSDSYLPIGIKEWYYLVDVAVRCEATFLLPLFVIQNFNISLPIYVESLGGFYIVEKIGEYQDDLTQVKVNLIKLPL